MNLKTQHFVSFVTILFICSCKQGPAALTEIHGKQLLIGDSIKPLDSLEQFVAPYRNRVNEVLDSTLAYAPYDITKNDGKLNTTAGNLMADIVLEQIGPVFKARTGKEIDFVLLNHGGIRSIISAGNVSARTAYEIMPFENMIVVAELNGPSVREMIGFLVQANRAHPIAGMQITLSSENELQSVNIKGAPFDENRTYFVATSDYLVKGGDNMGFFRDGLKIIPTDYKLRNALIDYFKKADTLKPVVDNRFIQNDP